MGLPTEISEFLFPNEPLTPAEPFVNQDINDNLQHFASEFPFLEEPSGVLSSNVDLDKSLDDLYGEISSIKNKDHQHFPSEFDFYEEPFGALGSNVDHDKSLNDLFSEISSLKNDVPPEQPEDPGAIQTPEQSATSEETTSSSPNPLRRTARTLGSISKAAKRKPPITNYVLEEILPTDSEAEKRRKRVRNCRAKKRAEDVDKEASMNQLLTENTRMEGNITQLEQEPSRVLLPCFQSSSEEEAKLTSVIFFKSNGTLSHIS